MFLAIDVGNTNVTIGIFKGDTLRATWRLATDIDRLGDEYGSLILSLVQHSGLSTDEVKDAAMTCVVPELEPVFQMVCSRYFGVTPLVVGVGTRTGLKVLTRTATTWAAPLLRVRASLSRRLFSGRQSCIAWSLPGRMPPSDAIQ